MAEQHEHTQDHNFDSSSNSEIMGPLTKIWRRMDKAWLVSVVVLGLIAGLDHIDAVMPTIYFVFDNLVQISPYLLLSVLLAAWIQGSGADGLVAKAFKARIGYAVVFASLGGALSPFCSCGVIPLIAGLLASGVPLAPVFAFWLASPVIDPEMLLITAGALGWEMAIAKLIGAIVIGALGGYIVMWLVSMKIGAFADPLSGGMSTCSAGAMNNLNQKPDWQFWKKKDKRKKASKELSKNGLFLIKWLVMAFILEHVMLSYVEMAPVMQGLNDAGMWALPAAAVVGVPAYVNGYAAIPLTQALMEMGLDPAAALTFMIAGGITCIPAAAAVKALTKFPVFIFYIGIALVGSVSYGYLFMLWLYLTA